MTRINRPVADRLASLQPDPPTPIFTISGVQDLYAGIGGRKYRCTISGYCRTQIFEFPGPAFPPNDDEPHYKIYSSPSVQACVTSSLLDYFANSTLSRHYAISPSLRHTVDETDHKIKVQQKGRVPVFLVIEETDRLTPVEMARGECGICDEVVVRGGKNVPYLAGGREGEKFIMAVPTSDGAWPELPNNQLLVNMILAGVRVAQRTSGPIRKYLDKDCLVTDDGRFVAMVQLSSSVRLTATAVMDTAAYSARISDIRRAIAALEREIEVPHIALLINSMYRDEHKDDAYRRLHFLQLWQSLSEAGGKYLGYQGDIRKDEEVVAGTKTLKELRAYRDDIAHCWTDSIDENFMADLQGTINELIRRKYC